jgi:dephospho-CoA kinase
LEKNAKLIGLTGGIGSGKSTVASIFLSLEIPVYQSDVRARELMNTDTTLRQHIINLLGKKAYLPSGEADRPWIANRVFTDKSLLQQLNEIIHPAVAADVSKWASTGQNLHAPYLIKESAILFEEELTASLDAVILVIAPEAMRIERVMQRDQITREKVLERINNQWPDSKKIPLADYIIYNDGVRSLIEQVLDIDKIIKVRGET